MPLGGDGRVRLSGNAVLDAFTRIIRQSTASLSKESPIPNWIINRLTAKGDPSRLREFLEAIKSDQQRFDFERVIPSPELIRHAGRLWAPPDSGEVSGERYFISQINWRDFTPEEENELEALGCRSWEDWAFANWGTNKIAFEVELDESTVDLGYVVIRFETAWSPPVGILERIREMFPDIAFGCEWFPRPSTPLSFWTR